MSVDRLQRSWTPGIRVQLMLWYTAVFALLILLFTGIFYTTLQASLLSGVKSSLKQRTEQVAAGISSDGGVISIQDVTGELPGLENDETNGELPGKAKNVNQTCGSNGNALPGAQANVNLGPLVRVLDRQGRACYISPAFLALSVPSASFSQPLRGVSWQGTVSAHNGQAVLLYSIPLTDNGRVFGVLQVGKSMEDLTETLRNITIELLVIVPFVLLLSAFGSYWLAKRAFRPIQRLIHAARRIKAGDLNQRVPVPQSRDEVQNLALTLNEMIERLEQAFMQQRRFVADASHELRTPVAAIRSMTDVALVQPLESEEYIAVLSDINAESERLGQLINNLLALTRADEGQVVFDRELVHLDFLVSDVIATMEPLATERGITLREGELEPATVPGDMTRLIQALMGLVDNALTYTNAGGTITLSVEIKDACASIVIRDTGIGIAPEDCQHIFERFYRADQARSRAAGGSGLGLAIVDWIVRMHEGSISVESQEGQGSIFTVELPLALLTSSYPISAGDLTQKQPAETRLLHH